MSQKANYFKLGLFVIGAIAAGVAVLLIIGTGRWLKPRTTIETYFNESVQGLDIGSKIKYRGVAIGEVTRITFTYVQYEQDKPMNQRKRYVLVEGQLEPRLVGGRAANDIASPESSAIEVERGLRVHLAPQGITGTNYLELDYVDALPAPVLPIDWKPYNIYIPSTPSTITTFVSAASEIIDRLHRLDIETIVANLNKLLVTTNERVANLDTAMISRRTERTLDKIDKTLDGIASRKISDEAVGLLAELRQTNGELKTFLSDPALRKLPGDTSAALAQVRTLVGDPRLSQSIAHMERTLGKLDRIFGAGEADLGATFENLRQITDNLRDLTEDAKRYPSNVLFGAPPPPLERKP
jgi:ABC-type transporter Mla subunit MlaD